MILRAGTVCIPDDARGRLLQQIALRNQLAQQYGARKTLIQGLLTRTFIPLGQQQALHPGLKGLAVFIKMAQGTLSPIVPPRTASGGIIPVSYDCNAHVMWEESTKGKNFWWYDMLPSYDRKGNRDQPYLVAPRRNATTRGS